MSLRTPRREYVVTLALLAAGGVLGLVSSSRAWGTARMPSSLSGSSTTVSGSDLLPFAPAVSLVALAAVVVVPAVRRIGRRLVGGALAVLGAALAVAAELAVLELEGRVESWVQGTATSGPAGGGDHLVEEVSTAPGWGLAAAAAGVMVLVAGLMIAVRGPAWPAMGTRYELRRSPGVGPTEADVHPRERGQPATARETWDALDRGDDPT